MTIRGLAVVMFRNPRTGWEGVKRWSLSVLLLTAFAGAGVAQEALTLPLEIPAATENKFPINLPTALRLADARAIDISLASQRIAVSSAQLKRANVLWLPTIYVGVDYYRHDGQLQDVAGDVFGTSKGAFMFGAGPTAVFAVTDALFAPLAARQEVRARSAGFQAAKNDTLLAVAEAYFNLQQARGDLLGAEDAANRAEELARRAEKLAPSIVPETETVRVRTERSRRRQAVHSARERVQATNAELARILRLDPASVLEPLESPDLRIMLFDVDSSLDGLIATALVNRPELAAHQALVRATLQRLKQERLRPLIPSVLLRGAATNPSGTLAGGLFGGGRNNDLSKFSARSDFDLQVLWEFQNLGLGNRARVDERRAENQLAVLELFRVQDQIAAEVVRAHAALQAASARIHEAEAGLKDALDSVNKNFEGMQQIRRVGEVNILVVRPQEAIAAIQALAQSYADHYGAIADFDRAQFRLYRALGHPAEAVESQLGASNP